MNCALCYYLVLPSEFKLQTSAVNYVTSKSTSPRENRLGCRLHVALTYQPPLVYRRSTLMSHLTSHSHFNPVAGARAGEVTPYTIPSRTPLTTVTVNPKQPSSVHATATAASLQQYPGVCRYARHPGIIHLPDTLFRIIMRPQLPLLGLYS